MHLGHSPNGEDMVLADIFGCHCGTFVDVGAKDGVTRSKSYLLELLGWQCVLIESDPRLFDRIQERREARAYHYSPGAWDGNITLHALYNSNDTYGDTAPRGMRVGGVTAATPVQARTVIPKRRLDTILAECGVQSVDVISISAPGSERSILRGLQLAKWAPRILLVESASLQETRKTAEYLAAGNYVRFRRTGDTDWYAHVTDRALVNTSSRLRLSCGDIWSAASQLLCNMMFTSLDAEHKARVHTR